MNFIAQTHYTNQTITEVGEALESAIASGDPVFIILASVVISMPFILLVSWIIYNHFKTAKEKDLIIKNIHERTRSELIDIQKQKEMAIIDLFNQLKEVSYDVMASMKDSSKALEKVFDQSDIHYRELKEKLEKTNERFEKQIHEIEKNIKEYIKDRL
jgi:ABC-type Na+ efflux pump permease subunit